MANGMKCGICGETERIVFETNHSYYGKDTQRKDSSGQPIKQLNDDGSVRMRKIYDAADMNEHKRFEHPQEVAQAEAKRKATKETNERAKTLRNENMGKVSRAGQKSVAVPVLDYDEYWQHRTNRVSLRANSAHALNTSRVDDYSADRARRFVSTGEGDDAAGRLGGNCHFRQITDADVVELTALDDQIKELQESRNAIAAQMYERGLELTNQHLADLGDAQRAAEEEFDRMLREGDELEATDASFEHSNDFGKLTDADLENIIEAAMANHPTKFITYSKEHVADALSAYGYTASSEVVRNGGHQRSA